MAVQSPSATIGLTMTLASQGLLGFPAAMALVLGENIGTTITAELATIGSTNIDAHRAARAHTMFNVFGVGLMLITFPYFLSLIEKITLWSGVGPAEAIVNGEAVNIARYLANGHTLFNITNALFFLLCLPWLVKCAIFLSPQRKKSGDQLSLPEFNDLYDNSPIAALAQVRSEILKMAKTARKTLQDIAASINNHDIDKLGSWKIKEDYLDRARKEITSYLTHIYQMEINEEAAREIHSFFRMANNIEKIGDSVEDLAELAEKILENKLLFSEESVLELRTMSTRIETFLDLLIKEIQDPKEGFMAEAYKTENGINLHYNKVRFQKIKRLQERNCSIEPGLWYIDIMAYLKRIGGYCFNIAQALTGQK